MLTVTTPAKKKIKKNLEKDRQNKSSLARVVYDPSNPARIGFRLDEERRGDHVILDNEGKKLLLIGPNMISALEDMFLDYDESLNDREFIITKA